MLRTKTMKLHSRVPLRKTSPTQYFFTKDQKLLRAYYRIRQECYRSVKGGPENFDGGENKEDIVSDILVVVKDGHVVGGGRLIGSTPEMPCKLPLEEEGFMVKDVFPELFLDRVSYCELGRIAVTPEFRDIMTINRICGELIQKAIRKGYKYQFSMAPLSTSRLYQRVSSSLNLPYPYVIHKDIAVPEKQQDITGGLKMYLGSLKLCDNYDIEMNEKAEELQLLAS